MTKRKLIPFAGDDGAQRGRPLVEIEDRPPKEIEAEIVSFDALALSLRTHRDWYEALRRIQIDAYQRDRGIGEVPEGYEIDYDIERRDRLMCRSEPVAEVSTERDLAIAHLNGRIVIEIDPGCLPEVRNEKVAALVATTLKRRKVRKPSRHFSLAALERHRILALFALQLRGHGLIAERKQLATWLFPTIEDEKARGDYYDRARKLLDEAFALLPSWPKASS